MYLTHQLNTQALRNYLFLFQKYFNKFVYLAYQTTKDYNRKLKEMSCINRAKLAKEEIENTHTNTYTHSLECTCTHTRFKKITAEAIQQKGKNSPTYLNSSQVHCYITKFVFRMWTLTVKFSILKSQDSINIFQKYFHLKPIRELSVLLCNFSINLKLFQNYKVNFEKSI